jgi:4-hydroxybenzoyl-CoA reductase subunit beta
MMRLSPFRYLAPATLAEAAAAMAEHGSEAMVLAGGTDLLPNLKRRQYGPPRALVSLRRLEGLRRVAAAGDGGLVVGAAVVLSELESHPLVRSRYPALAQAASLVSTPQIRNMATLGGNVCLDTRCNYYNQTFAWRKALGFCLKRDGDVCWVAPGSSKCLAVSSADTAPVLVALGASFRLVRRGAERLVPARDFFRDDGIHYLAKEPDEILTEVHLPPPAGRRSVYVKLRRRGSVDFPVLGVAVALRTEPDGTCTDAAIVLTAVASRPRPAEEAARLLVGRKITPDLVGQAARAAAKPSKPLDNTDFAYGYRKRMTEVFVARALEALA